jgi:pyridoxine 5-phosphate synthase
MVKLGVNIDHVATVRQARGGAAPDPLEAARLCEKAGAHGITVHLREDRRHIQPCDVQNLKAAIRLPLNLEMALSEEILEFALRIRPSMATLVPEKRRELTTEGGLDVLRHAKALRSVCARMRGAGIAVSLFIDPSPQVVEAALDLEADFVELHTGDYAGSADPSRRKEEILRIERAGQRVVDAGVGLNAGHGLDYENVAALLHLPGLHELNIGHSIVSRALMVGMEAAVREMLAILETCA